MKNIWRTAVKLAAVGLVCGCAVVRAEEPVRIGLLAPFEGRYREIGYAALYAVQMALHDQAVGDRVELLAVDDGGSERTAEQRARALFNDPRVAGVVVSGYDAASAAVQRAFGDLPVVISGYWDTTRYSETVFLTTPQDFSQVLTTPSGLDVTDAALFPLNDDGTLIGGDIFALDQFRLLRPDLSGILIASISPLPDDDFRARYARMGQFAPEANLIAVAAYDAALILLDALAGHSSRPAVRAALDTIFDEGYLRDATIFFYEYDFDGSLVFHSVND